MKSIDSLKPKNDGKPINTVEDIDYYNTQVADLRQQIEEINNKVNDDIAKLAQYIADNSNEIETVNLNAVTALINTLSSTSANITALQSVDINTENITALQAAIDNITAETLNVDDIIATDNITADSIEASRATFDTLNATSLNVSLYNFDTLNADEANISEAEITSLTSDTITANEAEIVEAGIQTLESNSGAIDFLSSSNATITNVNIENMDIGFLTHDSHYITITNDADDLILAPPYFANGSYRMYIIDVERNIPVFITQIRNDASNIWFSWSRLPRDSAYIDYCRIYDYAGQRPRVYFHFNANGGTYRVYYTSDSFDLRDVNAAPYTYEQFPFDISDPGSWLYNLLHDSGVYFSKAVDVISNEGQHDYASLILTPSVEWSNANLTPVEYNGTIDRMFNFYRPNQSLNTYDDVSFNSIGLTGLNNKYVITIDGAFNTENPVNLNNNNELVSRKTVIEADQIAQWNGSVQDKTDVETLLNHVAIYRGNLYQGAQTTIDPAGDYNLIAAQPDEYIETNVSLVSNRSVIRKIDNSEIIVSRAPVDITPAGIDEYQILRCSFPEINGYVDYRYTYATDEWTKEDVYLNVSWTVLYDIWDEELKVGDVTRIDYDFDTTHTNNIIHLGEIEEGTWNVPETSVTTHDVTTDIIHNPHFFVGTQEEYEDYEDYLEDDALCIISEE